jgi:FAD synthase
VAISSKALLWLVAMDLIERMREQLKFETESQLAEQIAKYSEKTKNILNLGLHKDS